MDALADFADRHPVDDDGDEAGRLGLSPNECIGGGGGRQRRGGGGTE